MGDLVKGRTCRTLNVIRKIIIRDIESTFRMMHAPRDDPVLIGTAVFEQVRGSPMGSPLTPALCLMVVALSEEVWFRTYQSFLVLPRPVLSTSTLCGHPFVPGGPQLAYRALLCELLASRLLWQPYCSGD